jgi:hypothetical protein
MTTILLWLSPALFMYALWVYYLAVMNLYRVHKKTPLTGFPLYLGYCVFAPALLLDIVGNLAVMTVLMVELPREWKVTDRMVRHVNGEDGWRKRFAEWFSTHLLDPFDPKGFHVKRENKG